MKRIWLEYIVTLLTGCCLVCFRVQAEEQSELAINLYTDETAHIITVDLNGNAEIEMLQFCLCYDERTLELTKVGVGEVFENTNYPTISTQEKGRLYFVWEALDPIKDGELLIIQFRKTSEDIDGKTSLWFDTEYDTIAVDKNYNEIHLNTKPIEIEFVKRDDPSTETVDEIVAPEDHTEQLTVVSGSTTQLSSDDNHNWNWSSSDETVVKIENGIIIGIGDGVALISGESEDGSEHSVYAITVVGDEQNSSVEETAVVQNERKSNNTGPVIAAATVFALLLLVIIQHRKKNKREK